jgi:two-component system, OmpR family, phosphate regulon sensor histidine kinase PhoR
MNTVTPLCDIAALIREKKSELLADWRHNVCQMSGARRLDQPTLDDHIPTFIDELVAALEAEDDQRVADVHAAGSPSAHGLQRLEDGFDIVEVVAEYNILRDALQGLIETHGLVLHGRGARIVNRVLDEAIGVAVKNYATQKAVELQQRREEHLAFVVHDLRTPLSAMSVAAQVLAESLPESGAVDDAALMVKTLKRNLGRLEILVTKVMHEQVNLVSSAGRKLELREVDVWPLVENLLHDLRPLSDASHTRLTNMIPKDFTVRADAALLTQVFQNLVSNALRYAPNGEVLLSARVVNGMAECQVEDDGEGIPAERLARVFDKLETDPDPEKSGTGLGLAIVKQAIEAHGGEVNVESRPDHGTIFRFSLPLVSSRGG